MIRTVYLAALVVCFSSFSSAADWNQWRGPNRDGFAPNSPPLINALPESGLKPLWITDEAIPAARSGGWSSPIVSGGRVYLFTHKKTKAIEGEVPSKKFPWLPPEKRVGMSDAEYQEYEVKRRDEDEQRARSYRFDESLYCLDAETGNLVWTNEHSSFYTRFPQSGTPLVVGDRAYLIGAGRVARCIDTQSGKDIWTKKLAGAFRDEFLQSSFALAEGVAVVSCGHMFGIDAKSGEVLWEGDANKTRSQHSSPAVWTHNEREWIIANVAGGDTICLEPKSGKELWRIKSEAGHSTPVIAGDKVITFGNSRKKGLRCYAMSLDGAEHLWTYQGAGDKGSSPVVLGDFVYVQGEKRFACVNLETGKAKWMEVLNLANPQYTSLVAADRLVIYAYDGVVGFSASPDGYEQRMMAKIDKNGLLADEDVFRKILNMDELEKSAEGQKEAARIWRQQFNGSGPLRCSSPAIVDGRIYVRLQNGLACYDLTASK